jgi:leader peptidase (prepilin peptidase)/N-methyltransferase
VTAPLAALACVVGLAVGSFLNVVIWRVPQGLSVVAPASACPACGTPIAARDNVPVLSWVLLRGRCRSCAAPISVRYPLVELGTAALFGLTTAWVGPDWALPAYLYLAAIAVALALIDLDVKRLPDAIVLPSYVVAAVLLAAAALADGDLGALLRAAIGGLVLWSGYFGLCLVKPGAMGFGDVKLAGIIGAYLGFAGWSSLVVGAFAGFLFGGVAGIALLLAGRAGRRSTLPFGPFMLAGTALGLVAGGAVATWYLQVTGLAGA